MKEETYKGDWINLVQNFFEILNLNLENAEEISNMPIEIFKVLVKRKV